MASIKRKIVLKSGTSSDITSGVVESTSGIILSGVSIDKDYPISFPNGFSDNKIVFEVANRFAQGDSFYALISYEFETGVEEGKISFSFGSSDVREIDVSNNRVSEDLPSNDSSDDKMPCDEKPIKLEISDLEFGNTWLNLFERSCLDERCGKIAEYRDLVNGEVVYFDDSTGRMSVQHIDVTKEVTFRYRVRLINCARKGCNNVAKDSDWHHITIRPKVDLKHIVDSILSDNDYIANIASVRMTRCWSQLFKACKIDEFEITDIPSGYLIEPESLQIFWNGELVVPGENTSVPGKKAFRLKEDGRTVQLDNRIGSSDRDFYITVYYTAIKYNYDEAAGLLKDLIEKINKRANAV